MKQETRLYMYPNMYGKKIPCKKCIPLYKYNMYIVCQREYIYHKMFGEKKEKK